LAKRALTIDETGTDNITIVLSTVPLVSKECQSLNTINTKTRDATDIRLIQKPDTGYPPLTG
jgi:hypothetical protein